MNLESSLRDLDGELRSGEPPLGTTAADVRRQAGVVRRRRRSVLAVSACVVAVAAIVIGPGLLRSSGSDNPPVAENAAMLAPDDLADVIRQIGIDHAPAGVGEDAITVEAVDANGNLIEGADRDKASEWLGEFDYGPDHRLDLRLTHGPMLRLDMEQGSCAAAVATKSAVSCDVQELADGSVVRAETRGVMSRDGRTLMGVTTDQFDTVAADLWIQRMVRHHAPDGAATTVTALARAEAAEALSIDRLVTDEELDAIAADSRLRFPAPPQTADGCAWTAPSLVPRFEACHAGDEEEGKLPAPDGDVVKPGRNAKPKTPLNTPPVAVSMDPTAPVDPDLEELARGFVDYALGKAEDLPVAVTVGLSLGGETAVHIDDIIAALPNRRIWQICPGDWEIYGAISCPVDVLGPVVSAGVNGTQLVISDEPGEVTCAPERTGPLPQGRLVAIRPEENGATCASDFSLVLAADDDGRLTAIDLTSLIRERAARIGVQGVGAVRA